MEITKQIRKEINQDLINERCQIITDFIKSQLNKADDDNYSKEVSVHYLLGTLKQSLKIVDEYVQIIKLINNR